MPQAMQYFAARGRHGGGAVDHLSYRSTTTTPADARSARILHSVAQQAHERFKGIRYRPELGRYISEIRPAQPRKRKIWLGTYKTPEEAARAFDAGIFYTKKSISYNFEDSPSILEPLPDNLSPEEEHVEIQKKAKAAAALAQPASPPQSDLDLDLKPSLNPDFKLTKLQSYRNSIHHHHHHHFVDHDNEHIFVRQTPKEIRFAVVLDR